MAELIKELYHSIDLKKNAIRNAKLNPLSTVDRLAITLTTDDEGFVVIDKDLDTICIWSGTAWILLSAGDFLSLSDTPDTYLNSANKYIRVNATEDGLEFYTILKSDIGLGNVDNTSDINKPISTAQQSALDLKADKTTTILANGNGIVGGGNLSTNRTLSLDFTYLDNRYAPLNSGVLSFNGRTGNVIPQNGDYTTSLIPEGTNLYYTDIRSRLAISSIATGITYNNASGVISLTSGYSIPTTVSQTNWNTAYNKGVIGIDISTSLFTLTLRDNSTITQSIPTWNQDTTGNAATATLAYDSTRWAGFEYEGGTLHPFSYMMVYDGVTNKWASATLEQVKGFLSLGTAAFEDVEYFATAAQGAKADTAYSWGNHASAGYFLASNFNSSFDTRFALKSTSNLSEGTNLYYTDARVLTYGDTQWVQLDGTYTNPSWIVSLPWSKITSTPTTLAGYGITDGVRSISGTTNRIAVIGGGTNTPQIDIASNYAGQSSIFNVGTITIGTWNGTAITDTYISSASNWNAAYSWGNHALAGYLTTISGIAAGGELAGTYANPTLVNSAVIGKILSGVNITGGTITSSDSILTAFGKVQNQINSLVGGMQFVDFWNATTNSPTIPTAIGNKGKYYIVQTAGTTSIDGITDWQVGDWVVSNGTTWGKIDNTDAVVSVNGFTGAVSLTTTHITEGTRLYFTDSRVWNALALTTTGSSGAATYNAGTGVFNIPNYTLAGLGGEPVIAAGTTGQFWRGDKTWQALTTSVVAEGSRLYFTDARVWTAMSWVAGTGNYNVATGLITIPTHTSHLTNNSGFITDATSSLTNYYTKTEIQNYFSGASAMTGYNKSNWDTAYSWGNHSGLYYTVGSTVANSTLWASMPYLGTLLSTAPTYIMSYLSGNWRPSDAASVAAFINNQTFNTLGTAQYATYATNWGGFQADFNAVASTFDYIAVRDLAAGKLKLAGPAAIAAYISGQTMNISGYATSETLATVTGRGNTTTTLSWFNSGIGFDQSGTRSWTILPTGGNLVFASGDGNGGFIFNATGVTVNGRLFAAKTAQTAYTSAALEVYTSDGGETGISFHRGGVSAGFLAHGSYGGLRFNGAQLLMSDNYNSYAPTLTGTGASGTWGISITGNANYATTAGSTTLLAALSNYVWSASTVPSAYALGIQNSFVSATEGFPNYGSVMTMKSYAGGGGTLQLYTPYGDGYGGTALRFRNGNYPADAWTAWKTLIDDSQVSVTPTANSIVKRDGSGYVEAVYFKSTNTGMQTSGLTKITGKVAGDSYMYEFSAAAVLTFLGSPSSGETLTSVTARGASTSTPSYFNGGAYGSNFGVGEMSFTSNQLYRASANEMYLNYSGTGQTIIGNSAGITLNATTTVVGTLYAAATGGNIYLTGTTAGQVSVSGSNLYLADWASGTKGLQINLTNGTTTFSSNASSAMTGGWRKTIELYGTYPTMTFNSNDTKWAAIAYDYSSNMIFKVHATSSDVMASGINAMLINSATGNISTYNNLTAGGDITALNAYFGNYLFLNSKLALRGTDTFLRLNQNNEFSSGIYTPYNFRVDGTTYLGGTTYYVNSSAANLPTTTVNGFVYTNGLVSSSSVSADINYGLYFGTSGETDYVIRRRPGSWTQPLDIKFFTGIRIGADYGYGGTIFYNSTNLTTALFSIGNTDNHIRMHVGGQKLITYNAGSYEIEAIKASYFGYSSSYAVLQVGDTRANKSIAFGVDLTGNTSGSFNGGGLEYIWKNAGKFITPNASNNGYNLLFEWNSVGSLTFGYNATINGLDRVLTLGGAGSGANSLLRYSDGSTAKWSTGFNGGNYIIYDDVNGVYISTMNSSTTTFNTNFTINGGRTVLMYSLPGLSYTQTGLEIYASGTYGPRISFHHAGVVASQIGIQSSGRIAILNNPGTSYENLIAADITSSGSFYGNLIGTWSGYTNNLGGGPYSGSPDALIGLSGTTIQRYNSTALASFIGLGSYLPLAGGTMSGNIAMNAYSITGATAFYTTGAILNSNQVYTPSGSFHVNYSGSGQTHIGNTAGIWMYGNFNMSNYSIENINGVIATNVYAGTVYSNTIRNTSGEGIVSYSSNVNYIGGGAAAHSLAFYAGGANRMQLSTAGSLVQGNTVYPNAKWGASSGTGPVVIKIPGGTGNYGMIHMTIAVYEYNSNAACTITVGGHNWSSGWYNAGVNVVGYTDKPVRLGFKDGQYCVVIGDGSSTWSYGQVVVMRVQNGEYYSGSIDLGGTWSVALESDSYTTISGDYRYLRTPKGMSLMDGVMRLGVDATYGTTYNAIGFGGSNTSNADNKIFAAANNLAGLFINAATGQNVYLRSGGSEIGYGNTSNWHFPQTADSTSSTSGALTTAGGFSAAKNIYAGAGIYAGSWFYNSGGTGLYNSSYGGYFYNESTSYWTLTSNYGLIIRTGYNSTVKGYLYYDGTGFGLLNKSGQWAVRTNTSSDNQLHGIWAVNMTPSTSYTFEVGGTLGTTGTITAGGKITGTAGGQDSDERLKDFHDFDALSIANTVRLRNYTWKDASKGTEHRYGYSAQAIQQVLPEAVYQVSRNGQTTLAVEYEMVHSVIIDEHTRRIQELEKRVKELEHELGK